MNKKLAFMGLVFVFVSFVIFLVSYNTRNINTLGISEAFGVVGVTCLLIAKEPKKKPDEFIFKQFQ